MAASFFSRRKKVPHKSLSRRHQTRMGRRRCVDKSGLKFGRERILDGPRRGIPDLACLRIQKKRRAYRMFGGHCLVIIKVSVAKLPAAVLLTVAAGNERYQCKQGDSIEYFHGVMIHRRACCDSTASANRVFVSQLPCRIAPMSKYYHAKGCNFILPRS
jgi:hypothetical protein